MNKKAIIGIFIGIVVIISGLIWLGGATTDQNGQANTGSVLGSLKAEETLFDFGTISMVNGKVNHEFRVTNNSQQPVTLNKVYTSCMCTAANLKLNGKTYGLFGMEGMGGLTSTNATINPGDMAIIEAIYDPNAHGPAGVGSIDRFIYLQDPDGAQLKFEIKAVVTP